MNAIYKELIDSSFIYPVNESQYLEIINFCKEYQTSLSTAEFERLCLLFILNEDFIEFKEKVKEALPNVKTTHLLCKNMAQVAIVSFFDESTISEEYKALYSLALKNILIAVRTNLMTFGRPDCLEEGLLFYDYYYKRQSSIIEPTSKELILEILTAHSPEEVTNPNFDTHFEEIKYYCQKHVREQYKCLKKQLAQESAQIANFFEKACFVAYQLANQDWEYMDENPVKSILSFFESDKTRKKSLYDIRMEIDSSGYYKHLSGLHPSSILLRYIDENKNYEILKNLKLNPKELAIALYHEYVFELINKKYYE